MVSRLDHLASLGDEVFINGEFEHSPNRSADAAGGLLENKISLHYIWLDWTSIHLWQIIRDKDPRLISIIVNDPTQSQ